MRCEQLLGLTSEIDLLRPRNKEMAQNERPILEQAMLESPRHMGLAARPFTEKNRLFSLLPEDEWLFRSEHFNFMHTHSEFDEFFDDHRLIFNEPDPENRRNLHRLLIGELHVFYAEREKCYSEMQGGIPEKEMLAGLNGLFIELDKRKAIGKKVPTLVTTYLDHEFEKDFKSYGFFTYEESTPMDQVGMITSMEIFREHVRRHHL